MNVEKGPDQARKDRATRKEIGVNTNSTRPHAWPTRTERLANLHRWLMNEGATQAEAMKLAHGLGISRIRRAVKLAHLLVEWFSTRDEETGAVEPPDRHAWLAAMLQLMGIRSLGLSPDSTAEYLDQMFDFPDAMDMTPNQIDWLVKGVIRVLKSSIFEEVRSTD